jgi:hypothetical protein
MLLAESMMSDLPDRLRIVVAFVLAPLLPSATLAFTLSREGQFVRVFALTAIVAYALTLVFAVPLFLWLSSTESGVTLRRVLVSAFLISAVPLFFLGVIAPASLLEGAALRRAWQIVGLPFAIGLLSMIGGAIFWLIAKTALKSRQQ